MLDSIINLWNGELAVPGSALLTLLVLNLALMLFGRFRFCFVSLMIFGYYVLFFANKEFTGGDVSRIGSAGAMIISGVVVLGFSIWAFFIDMD